MWVEIAAAALVGLSLLWLVFEPLFTAHGARPADIINVDALEDLEDTRSGVALAALKEIEFDRETGKLSDNDYDFLKQKYTVEALSAFRAEDQGSPAADIEAQVAARVATLRDDGRTAVACGACGAHAGPGSRFCPECGKPLGGPAACPKCGTDLPSGSRFCAACGGRVAA
ncbi:MAG: zinc ribbon domain-containing protein [Gemmatimonadales bacterium]|jgi:hypothetical protein